MITVIGLGVEKGDISLRAKTLIEDGAKKGYPVLVKTGKTASYQTVLDLGVEHTTLDSVYDKSRSFQTLNKNLAKAVVNAGDNAIYLIDGSASEDYSVKILQKKFHGKLLVVDGVAKTTAQAVVANFGNCSYSTISAYELLDGEKVSPLQAVIVYDMDDRALASDCKLILGDLFGEETKVKYIQGGKAKSIALYELDRQKSYDYSSAVAIEKQELLKKTRFSMADLKDIIIRLRAPDGCPWDKVQTSESIKMSAVEEAYELVDAIDSQDDDKILEEAGDILMQAVFHAVLKEETGAFNLTDIITGVCQKLITRHTHVFGNDKASDDSSALTVWEANKRKEKGQDTFAKSVNDVPKCFPAVMRAQKVGKRASKAGMDFACVKDASVRLQDELTELFVAIEKGNADEIEKEVGDLLFSAVNVGRKAGADCEKALKESVERFVKRFTLAEELALKEHEEVDKLSESEWDKYYLQAKEQLSR